MTPSDVLSEGEFQHVKVSENTVTFSLERWGDEHTSDVEMEPGEDSPGCSKPFKPIATICT